MSPEPLGWAASAILLATISRQVWRQAQSADISGVSHWLFIGQISASVLYLIYSLVLHNVVFVASNAALLVAAVIGQIIFWRRQHSRRAP